MLGIDRVCLLFSGVYIQFNRLKMSKDCIVTVIATVDSSELMSNNTSIEPLKKAK